MGDPKEVLTPLEYKNYRNIRAVALFFILIGSILLLAGVMVLTSPEKKSGEEELPLVAKIVMPILGFLGVVGGIAVRKGDRKYTPAIYALAVPYLLAFPIGTILSYVLLKGMKQYLSSIEKLQKAA